LKLARILLTNGANINAEENSSYTGYVRCRPSILYKAVETGITKLIQLLLTYGADVNGHGWTRNSSDYFAKHPDDDTIESKWFLDRYDSILLGGINAANVEMVELLLDVADVKALDSTGARTLIVAAGQCSYTDWGEKSKVEVILSMVVDKLLEIRGADDPIFSDDIDELRISMTRFERNYPK
jgi:hypothetical protein